MRLIRRHDCEECGTIDKHDSQKQIQYMLIWMMANLALEALSPYLKNGTFVEKVQASQRSSPLIPWLQ